MIVRRKIKIEPRIKLSHDVLCGVLYEHHTNKKKFTLLTVQKGEEFTIVRMIKNL